MDRRRFLESVAAAAGISVVSGCSAMSGGTPTATPTPGPQYDAESSSDLLLTSEAFPSRWERDDELNESFDRVFRTPDINEVVFLTVDVYEGIEEAATEYDDVRSEYPNPEDLSIGDEAFHSEEREDITYVIFRDSNALGQVGAFYFNDEVTPTADPERAREYANAMYDRWQDR